MKKKIFFAFMTVIAAAACKEDELAEGSPEAEAFKNETEAGIYQNSNNIFLYDKDIHQYAFNTQHHTFMIQNNAQSRYLICSLSDAPQTGSTVSVEFTAKSISNFNASQLDMQVIKAENGKYWLFDQATGTGLLIIME